MDTALTARITPGPPGQTRDWTPARPRLSSPTHAAGRANVHLGTVRGALAEWGARQLGQGGACPVLAPGRVLPPLATSPPAPAPLPSLQVEHKTVAG